MTFHSSDAGVLSSTSDESFGDCGKFKSTVCRTSVRQLLSLGYAISFFSDSPFTDSSRSSSGFKAKIQVSESCLVVGMDVGLGDGVGVSVGLGDGVGVSVGLGDGVGVSVGLGDGDGVSVGLGDGEGVGGLRIVRVAELGLPKIPFPGRLRLRLTVLLFLAVVRIGILKLRLVKALVKINVPVVLV